MRWEPAPDWLIQETYRGFCIVVPTPIYFLWWKTHRIRWVALTETGNLAMSEASHTSLCPAFYPTLEQARKAAARWRKPMQYHPVE